MFIITTRKKLKEKLRKAYRDGYNSGSITRLTAIDGVPTIFSIKEYDPPAIVYSYARSLMLESLRELRNNTWDKDRVDDLIEVLEDMKNE